MRVSLWTYMKKYAKKAPPAYKALMLWVLSHEGNSLETVAAMVGIRYVTLALLIREQRVPTLRVREALSHIVPLTSWGSRKSKYRGRRNALQRKLAKSFVGKALGSSLVIQDIPRYTPDGHLVWDCRVRCFCGVEFTRPRNTVRQSARLGASMYCAEHIPLAKARRLGNAGQKRTG